MPNATPEQIRAAMAGLSPEQQKQFIDELEKRQSTAGAAALSGVEGISESPTFDKPLYVPGVGELPSPSQMAEALPAGLSALGGALGRYPGAVIGGSLGELLRQGARKLAGYAPATGMAQEALGLDPSSLEASVAGVASEALGAALPEAGMAKLAGKAPGPLRKKSLELYAGLLEPKGSASTVGKIAERLKPIADDLPTGFRGRIGRVAEEKGEEAGKEVAKVYSKPTPASYDQPIEDLRAAAAKKVRTPMTELPVYDDAGNLVDTVKIPPDVSDPAVYKGLQERVRDLQTATERRKLAGGQITLEDLFKQRKTESELAERAAAKTFKPGLRGQDVPPKARAHKEARTAISEEMKRLTGSKPATATSPAVQGEGEIADAIHTAWKTVAKGAQQTDPGTFISRWFLARTLPVGGTAAGAVAANPAFWHSVGSKGMRKLANLIEAGENAQAEHLVRGFIATFNEEQQ